MNSLDLYAKVEHLLGIDEATKELHNLYLDYIDEYKPKSLLDVGCGRGEFLKKLPNSIDGVGCDLSSVMVSSAKKAGLNVFKGSICDIDKKFDVIVAIFDVLNFLDKDDLDIFLECVSQNLNKGGVFLADINTLHGFSNVADGVMSNEDEKGFLNVEAIFEDNILNTTFTYFEKDGSCYKKYQDCITQYFHPIKLFKTCKTLKLIEKIDFSLYDTKDKTLLVMKKI